MKRKDILARAITLSLLLAMPLSSAWAADLTIDTNTGNLGEEWNRTEESYYIYHNTSLTGNTITIDGAEVKGSDWDVLEKDDDGYQKEDGKWYYDFKPSGEKTGAANLYGGYAREGNNANVSDNKVVMNGGSTIRKTVSKDFYVKETEIYGSIEVEQFAKTTFNTGSIIGGRSDGSGNVTANTVTIQGESTVNGDAIGGYSTGAGEVSGNAVALQAGTVNGALIGGQSDASGNVSANTVAMSGGTVTSILGGYSYTYGTGDVTGNKVEITGGTINSKIYGGSAYYGSATKNTVDISKANFNGNENLKDVYGGWSSKASADENVVNIADVTQLDADVRAGEGATTANGNKVTLTNVTFGSTNTSRHEWAVYGGKGTTIANDNEVVLDGVNLSGSVTAGQSTGGEASGNKITVTGEGTTAGLEGGSGVTAANNNIIEIESGAVSGDITVGYVSGAGGTLENNSLKISGGTISSNIIKVGATSNGGRISGNSVEISGGTFEGNVTIYTGYTAGNAAKTTISDNTITVAETADDLRNVSLYAGYTKHHSVADCEDFSNNALVLDGWRGTVNTVGGLTDLQFANLDLSADGAALAVASETDLTDVNIAVTSLAEGADLAEDAIATIIDNSNNLITFGDVETTSIENVDASGNGVRMHELKTVVSSNDLVANVTKSVLANTYTAADGTVTANDLVIDEGFATQASVVAGAYASGEKTAEGGVVTINGDYAGTVYAGYSESGSVGENTINLGGGVQAASLELYGSNTDEMSGVLNAGAGVNKLKSVTNFKTIDLGEQEQTLNIETLSGDGTTFIVNDVELNQANIGTNNDAGLTVYGTEKVGDGLNDTTLTEDLQEVVDRVAVANGIQKKNGEIAQSSVRGGLSFVTDDAGKIVSYTEGVNTANQGISEMASISLMAWRQENNDMNKRLGELRDSKGEHGVWARMTRGEAKYGNQNIKNQYNSYQLGYDEKLSVDKHWTVGAAFTYTDAESSFTSGRGENKHKGFAVYGSRLNDDGSFIDLIAKYARLEHEFEVSGGAGKGDYDTNGYSLSAEYGKRFTKDNGLWLEPQVELTYGRVGSVGYLTNQGVNVRQNGMDSLVARLGFALGKDLANDKGNVHLRASYLYDFDGETDVQFAKNGASRSFGQDLGGGWWEVGVGTNVNLSDAMHLYFDVEKTYGGNVATPWQWNAGLRWSF